MITKREITVLGALAALSVGAYIWYASLSYGAGFPLDDSWIHHAYARNLANNGEWALLPGQPSAGATSPLWVLLLAIGHFFRLSPFVWTGFLGWISLWMLGVVGTIIFRQLVTDKPGWAIWAGMFIVLEWHLVWGAASGMETAIFIAAGLILFAILLGLEGRHSIPKLWWFVAGITVGFSVLIRPDGITFLAPLFLAIILLPETTRQKTRAFLPSALGFFLLFAPYFALNYLISGTWWPTTLYAKQAEYTIILDSPLLARYLRVLGTLFVGASVLLVPGFIFYAVNAWRQKRWAPLLVIGWLLGFLLMYAIRLPLTYQHGRYEMPAMAAYFLLGFAGQAQLSRPNDLRMGIRVLNRAWLASTAATLAAFWVIGARAYAEDVGWIKEELMTATSWINENTREDDVVATHDIGALGYFAQRPLVDLAGLISPEIITYIHDEGRLAAYMNANGVDYLVTFPGWYPQLVRQGVKVFQSEGEISPRIGGENIAVYKWPNATRGE